MAPRYLVVTESAAIDLYLADRYALGRLAPKWELRASSAGWDEYAAMLTSSDQAVSNGDFLVGDMCSIADVILGGTVRYVVQCKMRPPSAAVAASSNASTRAPPCSARTPGTRRPSRPAPASASPPCAGGGPIATPS